ncbi:MULTISPECIES: argininosuccinate synthase-related protein [Pseudomonas syringae group]|uniref:argininosuccinate synthase-related protein n=1 Tax=Pseudomonas syringae group TaxID=136849 RepID=UPI000CCFF210|nr:MULTISPECIES: argininosuccinate synthase-related protein [Pseudomonas syringae group]MBS7422901.1 argininosuccinate synthase-related protein [Pseudomonas syringae]MBS7434638.1 argininosuccinate synthase-related protein [Pseudomonas syringae]MCF5737160.1 argininosuccinate synthase [Pseudomonas syringae]MCF5742436.1 argininosuccinate synthase [Pseudomonas syringae]MCF5753062.1 argininosuccinate synthase [Pseudomonas syringae]
MKSLNQIRSLSDLKFVTDRCKRILTLFSGGVDSSYVLKELANASNCEVIALTIDLGDGVNHEDLNFIASHFGARSIVLDGRETFAREAVLPALRCNAQYMSIFPISASLSRPIISRMATEIAQELGCGAIVHTANQSQNSLRRLNGAIHQLGFNGFFGSPYEYSALSRDEKIAELKLAGLDLFQARGTSGDSNLWCREFESGTLDNPEDFSVSHDLFEWTTKRRLDDLPNIISVTFHEGTPVAVDGVEYALIELIALLNQRVGAFGIGRYAGLEHLEQGEKVLEVREAPAAHLLMSAYRHLETASLETELIREKHALEQTWVREAVEGRWFGHLREAIDQFVNETARHISGVVQYTLREGVADLCSIRAVKPRYLTDRDSWEKRVAQVRGSRNLSELHAESAREKETAKEKSRDASKEAIELTVEVE